MNGQLSKAGVPTGTMHSFIWREGNASSSSRSSGWMGSCPKQEYHPAPCTLSFDVKAMLPLVPGPVDEWAVVRGRSTTRRHALFHFWSEGNASFFTHKCYLKVQQKPVHHFLVGYAIAPFSAQGNTGAASCHEIFGIPTKWLIMPDMVPFILRVHVEQLVLTENTHTFSIETEIFIFLKIMKGRGGSRIRAA